MVLSFALSEWVIPYTNEQAKRIKSHRTAAELGEVNGYWSREGQRFIYIDYANSKGQLKDVQVVDFDENYRLRGTFDAEQGHFVKEGHLVAK